jgi:hypothetical protein
VSAMRRALAGCALLAAMCAGCDRRAPLASCADGLHGVYVTPAGARWMVLDHGATLEGYPMFDDALAAPVGDGAPRVIDLRRAPHGGELAGEIKRRFAHGPARCEARAPVYVTACRGDVLEVELADPPVPATLAPCTLPPPDASRAERWRRSR